MALLLNACLDLLGGVSACNLSRVEAETRKAIGRTTRGQQR